MPCFELTFVVVLRTSGLELESNLKTKNSSSSRMVNGQADTAALQHYPGRAVEFLHLAGEKIPTLSYHHLSSAAFRLLNQVIRIGQ